MQTIKCVVVGDGAVGKVRIAFSERNYETYALRCCALDLPVDLVHDEQVSQRVRAHCESPLAPRQSMPD